MVSGIAFFYMRWKKQGGSAKAAMDQPEGRASMYDYSTAVDAKKNAQPPPTALGEAPDTHIREAPDTYIREAPNSYIREAPSQRQTYELP